MRKAIVDQNTCIGCALCCSTCGEVFRLNEDVKAEAYQAATEENQEDVQNAIDSCPVAAIRWAETTQEQATPRKGV